MFKSTVVKPTIDQSSYSIPKNGVYHGIPNAIGFYWGWFMVGFTTLLPPYIHHISREWSIYPALFSQQNCLTWIICALLCIFKSTNTYVFYSIYHHNPHHNPHHIHIFHNSISSIYVFSNQFIHCHPKNSCHEASMARGLETTSFVVLDDQAMDEEILHVARRRCSGILCEKKGWVV